MEAREPAVIKNVKRTSQGLYVRASDMKPNDKDVRGGQVEMVGGKEKTNKENGSKVPSAGIVSQYFYKAESLTRIACFINPHPKTTEKKRAIGLELELGIGLELELGVELGRMKAVYSLSPKYLDFLQSI